MKRFTLTLCMLLWASGCGLESPIINVASRDKSTKVPDAADNVVYGAVTGAPVGTPVIVYGADGIAIEGIAGQVDASGLFSLRFSGDTEFSGLRLEARWPEGQAFGLLPSVPRQLSVLDPERQIILWNEMPALSPMSVRSTTFSLIVLGQAIAQGRTLAALPADVVAQTTATLSSLLDSGNGPVTTFAAMVQDLVSRAGTGGQFPFAGEITRALSPKDLLNPAFLVLTGSEVTAEAFEAALLAAAGEVQVAVCYATDRIRVVFLADLRAGIKDHNCAGIDPFKWAADVSGKTMYFTGGVHKTTPICGKDGTPPHCIDNMTLDAANVAMGNWVPNLLEMHDDGTNGDAVKGDRVFTLSLDLPYFPLAGSPDGRGVRVGYKYTWGLSGDGWTQTEEWPGNQRLLELVDMNGDGLVVRMDAFGDESSNKDKANLLMPTNGGCGVNYWENEIREGCGHDTRESMVDVDGDCKVDAWPSAGSISPLTIPCS